MARFNRVKADNGQVIYTPRIRLSQHHKMDRAADNDAAAIRKLKSQLEKLVDGANGQVSQALNKDFVPQRGKAGAAFRNDAKKISGEIPKLVNALLAYGVRAKVSIPTGKVSYTEGGDSMYNSEKLKEMKLEVYEERAAGSISEAAASYLIEYFNMKGAEAYLEEAGCSKDDIDDLVKEYIKACSDGDDDSKADLEEKIKAITTSKKSSAALDSLKEGLDEREKKFVDELEEKISNNEDVDGPATEGADPDAATDEMKKLGSGVATAKGDKKDAAENLKELDAAMGDAVSASLESGLSDVAQMAMLDFVTESVATGEMDPERADYLTSVILG